MNYGYFDDDAKEYVITTPFTPLPWINYLGSESFFGLISNTAGGDCGYDEQRASWYASVEVEMVGCFVD